MTPGHAGLVLELALRMTDGPVTTKSRSRIRFPPDLPITARIPEICRAIDNNQVIIVVGATGSGKTTQLPKIALELGRGGKRQIGVTQPRRIAATSVAARVARELECELGAEVGYQIRFENRTCRNTWVKFMTDGILLAEIQQDRLLHAYDTLIIDEAHERSLNVDFLLGWLKQILPARPDLKIIVSSATIATEHFSEFFDNAPVIEVEGRTFPVEVLYEPQAEELDLPEAVAAAVVNVTALDPHGDVLVFLPGEREIRETEQALTVRNLRHTEILPLYARLASGEQSKVFAPVSKRRVILATNVAETSLTIPGIVYVIDAGLARLSRYDPRTGTTRLQVEAISQASADQRKGRCGRVREGVCVRLFELQDFDTRPKYTDPEIKRTGLAGVILRMMSLGLGKVEDFPFLDPPHGRSVAEGYRVLQELGALDDDRQLTELGRRLSQFPVDPRVARMILAGKEFGCLSEVLVVAAALNVQDPRERPRGKEPKADQLHQRFRDERSDFVGILRLWAFVREQQGRSRAQLRRACRESFLSDVRVREWIDLHRQLEEMAIDERLAHVPKRQDKQSTPVSVEYSDGLHLALLTGLLSRVGQWNPEQRAYRGARQTLFSIHPSSGLAKKPPAWVMAFELVETKQLYARMAAKVEPDWLAQVGAHLLKRSYSDPHWSEKSARASVKEHATLFGLSILKDRSVDYAGIAPVRARSMFIEHALVRGEYQSRGEFQRKNRQLLLEVARLRDKARQSDVLVDDERLYSFFEPRVPEQIVNGRIFEDWREQAEKSQPSLLELSLADVLDDEQRLLSEGYPDRISLHGFDLAATYRFDPSAEDDGVTLCLPLVMLAQLSPGDFDWTIPAWHRRKITGLLEGLPRSMRHELGQIEPLAAELVEKLTYRVGPILPAFCRAIHAATGVSVLPAQLRVDALPRYLRFNFRIAGEREQIIAEGRDLEGLLEQHGGFARELYRRRIGEVDSKAPRYKTWQCGDIPLSVARHVDGVELRCYPALRDRNTAVELALFETKAAADGEHRAGVRRLIALASSSSLASIVQRMPSPLLPRKGLPTSRADMDSYRELLLARILDAAFGLTDAEQLPRSKAAFEQVLGRGASRLGNVFQSIQRAMLNVVTEYEKLQRALEQAAKHPSGVSVTADIRRQLESSLPVDLFTWVDWQRLSSVPRYLRAAQLRIARATVDPRKDAAKAEPLARLYGEFLAKFASARDRAAVDQLRWAFEELRVATFAPELKPAESVSIAGIRAALLALG